MHPQIKYRPILYRIFLWLTAVEGLAVFLSFFTISSMERNERFLGLSAQKLALAALTLGIVVVIAGIAWALHRWQNLEMRVDRRFEQALATRGWLLPVAAVAFVVFLTAVYLMVLFAPGVSDLLDSSLRAIFTRARFLNLWLMAGSVQLLAVLWLGFNTAWRNIDFSDWNIRHRTLRAALTAAMAVAILFYAIVNWVGSEIFIGFFWKFMLAAMLLWVLSWLHQHHRGAPWYRSYMIALAIFFVVFGFYRATTYLVGRPHTPGKAYFDQLAESFVEGRLYLEDVTQTHDLTFHDGQWYVANPPMAAVLMAPWVAVAGGAHEVNTVLFSIFFGALNASLVFLILEALRRAGWAQLGAGGNLWLTLMFAFGTVHWYLAIVGKMWFMSQMVTITFFGLAILLALANRPAWTVGLCLGCAMAARPNIVLAWFVVFTVVVQKELEANGRLRWGRLIRWCLLSVVPIFMVGLALLGYNYARFGSIWDYGYLTENVADWMAGDLKDYGTFNIHFVQRNLRVMLFGVPEWDPTCGPWPKHEGMSIFLTTPALLYLVRSFRKTPFVVGTWLSTLLLIVPLAFYYNTGAWQFGYKYLLDFVLPVMMLMAVAAGDRVSKLLKGLIIAGVAINAAGVLWWFGLWCLNLG